MTLDIQRKEDAHDTPTLAPLWQHEQRHLEVDLA